MRARLRDAADFEDETIRTRAVKWALGSETRSRIESLLWFAASLPSIADPGDHWDADPWLLGVVNGVVDLRTGVLRPGDPDDRLTMQTAVTFDPEAACPRWTQFIAEIFNENVELVSFVQRAIGYSITGITTDQCLFLLFGTGANGKGTLTNTLKWTLGDYAWNMPFATIEWRDRAAIPNDLAALVNRRFVIASETNDGTRLNESRVKALTRCDPMTARFLHGEFFEFQPIGKYWLSVNHKPIVRDDSYGFWRRLRLIPFAQTFSVNQGLADELRAEASGILAWCVRGCLSWREQGLTPPAVVTDATREYEVDSDLLAAFLAEACELDTASEIRASELFEHYRQWAERHGMTERERLSSTMFGRKLSERFGKLRDSGNRTIYRGLGRK